MRKQATGVIQLILGGVLIWFVVPPIWDQIQRNGLINDVHDVCGSPKLLEDGRAALHQGDFVTAESLFLRASKPHDETAVMLAGLGCRVEPSSNAELATRELITAYINRRTPEDAKKAVTLIRRAGYSTSLFMGSNQSPEAVRLLKQAEQDLLQDALPVRPRSR